MFIVIKSRKSATRWKDEIYRSAYLVSCIRTQRGPRHKQHGYCGTVAFLRGQPASLWALHWFWAKAEARLATLALPREQEARLRAALRQRIGPQPSQEALEADLRERAAVIKEALTLLGSIR